MAGEEGFVAGNNLADPNEPGGPSGWLALLVMTFCLLFGSCFWPPPPHFQDPRIPLLLMFYWGIAMTAALATATASIRRGPAKARGVAFLAFAISLLCVGSVVVRFSRILLR